MIFSIEQLSSVTDKIITASSIEALVQKTLCISSSDDFSRLYKLSEKEFIEKLEKYDGGQFYGIRKNIFDATKGKAYSASSLLTNIAAFFADLTSKGVYGGQYKELLNIFYSCFFISAETIKTYAIEVEKSLEGLEDTLSFTEYLEAYENEMKNLIENYQLIRS